MAINKLSLSLTSLAAMLGLVGVAYLQNWPSVCYTVVVLALRVAEGVLAPKKQDDLVVDMAKKVLALNEAVGDVSVSLSELKSRLGKLEIKSGMRVE